MVLVLHCSTLCDIFSLLFFFSLFMGFALHNIHTFHSRLVFYLKKRKRKKKQNVFCIIFLDLKSRLANLFLHNMFMYFV